MVLRPLTPRILPLKTFVCISRSNFNFIGTLIDELGETMMKNRHFEEHHVLYETASKQMILIAKGLGKQEFKNHLQSVFDILFYAARSQVLLTKAAAEECLAALSKFLGIY